MSWVTPLIGIPHVWGGRDPATGWDCWGLVTWALRHQFGVDAPDACAPRIADDAIIAARASTRRADMAAATHMVLPAWRRAAAGPGRVALFRLGGQPFHVGLMISRQLVLHVSAGNPTRVDSIAVRPWAQRLEGVYAPL